MRKRWYEYVDSLLVSGWKADAGTNTTVTSTNSELGSHTDLMEEVDKFSVVICNASR